MKNTKNEKDTVKGTKKTTKKNKVTKKNIKNDKKKTAVTAEEIIINKDLIARKDRITIKDVAKIAGVSIGTVSRVLSGKTNGLITLKTQKTILKIAHELNYTPNKVAQALVSGKTKQIAIIAYTIRTNYFATVIYRLNEIIRRNGYDLKVIFAEENTVNCQLNDLFVDAVILFDTVDFLSEDIHNLVLSNKPTVCIGSLKDEKYSYVSYDAKKSYKELLEHLYETGKRKIAVYPNTVDIKNAYDEFVAEKKLETIYFENHLDNDNFLEIDFVYKNVSKHIEKYGVNFDGVLCINDQPALGVIRALTDHNISIPDEVAVTGFDDSPASNFYTPRLTTMKVSINDLIINTWRILSERLNNPDLPPEHVMLKPQIKIRESTINKN